MPTFETPDPLDVTIELTAGHVQIHASDRTDTVVEVSPADASRDVDVQTAEQTQVEYANGELTVKAPKNKFRTLFGRPPSINLTVKQPNSTHNNTKNKTNNKNQNHNGESS